MYSTYHTSTHSLFPLDGQGDIYHILNKEFFRVIKWSQGSPYHTAAMLFIIILLQCSKISAATHYLKQSVCS